MAAKSSATTRWQGDIKRGGGVVTPESGAFAPVDVSMPFRLQRSAGKTSPEELLAGAHAACFCMAVTHSLGDKGEDVRLETTATVEFVPGQGVTSSQLTVRAVIPDISQHEFDSLMRAASEGCPISAALKGNVEVTVDATLVQSLS